MGQAPRSGGPKALDLSAQGYATFASSALMDPITKNLVASIHRFCRDGKTPLLDFVRGQRKDDVAQEHLARFTAKEGVLFVGRARRRRRCSAPRSAATRRPG